MAGPEVLEFIASRIQTNIRELEGALIRVTAFASLNRQQVDLALAEIVLKDLIPEGGEAQITTGMIMAQTASYFDLRSRSRGQSRHVWYATAAASRRELTDLSFARSDKAGRGSRDERTPIVRWRSAVASSIRSRPTNRMKAQAQVADISPSFLIACRKRSLTRLP